MQDLSSKEKHMKPHFLLVDPAHYDVSYVINPWMDPEIWASDSERLARQAREGFDTLVEVLEKAGARTTIVAGQPGLPDMVFPANAGIVLDRRVIPSRFLRAERQGEEPWFQDVFRQFIVGGILDEIVELPDIMRQEGAGDCLWDATRRLAWVGYGQRSDEGSAAFIRDAFDIEIASLRLATPRFYHLDTCFHVLPRGEVLYFPDAFTEHGRSRIEALVPAHQRLVASEEEARQFCVNAVAFGDDVIMAEPPESLLRQLQARGYRVTGVPLAPFILSGGGAYCMTLRLDNVTR